MAECAQVGGRYGAPPSVSTVILGTAVRAIVGPRQKWTEEAARGCCAGYQPVSDHDVQQARNPNRDQLPKR